jgi:hypothetical protein
MSTLDVLKNEVMGVLSTMSSIHKIFSTFTQFHFEKTNDFFFKTMKETTLIDI